jgi:hypothetical protein
MLLSAKRGKQGDVGLLRVAGSKTHSADVERLIEQLN